MPRFNICMPARKLLGNETAKCPQPGANESWVRSVHFEAFPGTGAYSVPAESFKKVCTGACLNCLTSALCILSRHRVWVLVGGTGV
jgi:hypothetical protein